MNIETLFIDKHFIDIASPQFERFAWKKKELATCRCPICGDSEKKKTKARFYFYPDKKKTHFCVKCHNCGYSNSFSNFLKNTDAILHQEYLMKVYEESVSRKNLFRKPEENPYAGLVFTTPVFRKDLIGCVPIVNLPDDHPAKAYLIGRMIPLHKMNDLYYAEDFSQAAATFGDGWNPKDSRIVIPFYTREGVLFALQGRAIDSKSQVRYITARDKSIEYPKVYNLDKVDPTKKVYVFEGPFDSKFVENSIAMGGASVDADKLPIPRENMVFVFDNEPRNLELVNAIKRTIDAKYKVCIWPSRVSEKDVNNMVLAGLADPKELIDKNSYAGLMAHAKLSQWRKV